MTSYWIKWDNEDPQLWTAGTLDEIWRRVRDKLMQARTLEWMVKYE
jgi:hypothetical protein